MNKSHKLYLSSILGLIIFPALVLSHNSENIFYDIIFYKTQNKIYYNNNEISNFPEDSGFKIFKFGNNSVIAAINNKLFQIKDKNTQVDPLNIFLEKPIESLKNTNRDINGITETLNFVLFKHTILEKKDNKYFRVKTNLSASKRFVSIASDGKYLYLGTAVNGLYYSKLTRNSVFHFSSMNKGLPFIPFDEKVRFYEEIRQLHVTSKGDLVVGTGIHGGVYLKKSNSSEFETLPWPLEWQSSNVHLITDNGGEVLWVSCSQGLIEYDLTKKHYTMRNYPWSYFNTRYNQFVIRSRNQPDLYGYYFDSHNSIDEKKIQRMEKASNKKLFYSSPYNLKSKTDTIKKLLNSDNFNGIILDIKDDHGFVLYKTNIDFIKKSGAIKPVVDLKAFVDLVHKYKKYFVARIVVFKDPVLFKNNKFAIWTKTGNKPWIGNPRERWVDPYNPLLAEKYYIPLIRELGSLGVDEIQLDYIRFPGEGKLQDCKFRYKKNDKYPSEAIEDFLLQIRQSTNLPISIDIFGYQGLYRTGGFIGQDMEAFGNIVDVISPMLYSSHFGDQYLTDTEIDKRVYRLIEHSIRRAEFISSSKYLIRPYLQAFPMKNNIWGYGKKYFIDQVEASKEQSASGFSFWGSLDHMIAVDSALEGVN